LAVAAAGASVSTARGEGFSGELDLALRKALARDPAKPAEAANLVLHLEAVDGRWRRVWGKGLGIGEHMGIVESADVTDEAVRLKLRMLILGDFWIKGRWAATFDIALERRADGSLLGRYGGTFKGRPIAGAAEGKLLPPRPVKQGHALPAMNEHPRVLFRKSDLPRLREKLKTPLGQAYLRQVGASGDMINLGVLHQLTGDASYADRARIAIEAACKGKPDGKIPVFGFGSGGFGHEIFRAAVAYDLCVDAWPAAFSKWLRTQLEAFTQRQQFVLMTSHANFHPCSNYYGPGRGVPGVVSLILWGDKGPEPKKPADPLARAWPLRPPAGFTPGKGVPVADLAPGKTPRNWIWTGLLPKDCSRDVMSKLGGMLKARPAEGTRCTYLVKSGTWFKEASLTFTALPAELGGEEGILVGKAAGDAAAGGVSVYFTAVRVKKEQVLRPALGGEGVRMCISGVELGPTRFYRIFPGVHPLTVEYRSAKIAPSISPHLAAVDPDASSGPLGLYKMDRLLWEQDHALWKRTGMDPIRRLWVDRGWWQNMQHYLWGIGEGGFKAETGGYANIASWYPSVYAAAYESFFGRTVSPYPDITHVMPRQMMQGVFGPGDPKSKKGRKSPSPTIVKLNSALSVDAQWMACHFPIIPEKYKPAALWVWNYLTGVSDEASIPNAVGGSGGGSTRQAPKDITLAQSFVNYPLDMKPAHPAKSMPLTWEAKTFGFYVFRSGWQGTDEFVSQVFAKAAPVVGWNHPNAASFTIHGLGRTWTDAPTSRNGVREQYSVALLPDSAELNTGACGRVTHYEAREDGSGSVSIDMGDVYSAKARLYDGMFLRDADRFRPSGVTGLRAMAFDYSGTCGAPALVVLVDKIRGGGKKLWTWQRPGGEVSVEAGGFTLRYPDASMRATFITPKDVKIESGADQIKIGTARKGFHGTLNRIKAEGGDDYFVVLTFQRGRAPKVTVDGTGLDAKATVGGQTVRFDGEKIIVGQ